MASGLLALCAIGAARSGTTPDRYGNDFTVFYAAAQQAQCAGNPYVISIRAATPYLYPPLFAQLLSPLTVFPLPTAAFLWAVGNIGGWIWLARLASAVAGNQPQPGSRQVWWWVSLAPLLIGNVLLGQVNIWIAALVTFAVVSDARRQRSGTAGLALAVATSIKLTPALLIPYFVGRRAWRIVGWWAAWAIVLNGLSAGALGSERWAILHDWYATIVVQGWRFDFATPSNQSLYGAALRVGRAWFGCDDLPYWPLALVGAGGLFWVGHAGRHLSGASAYPAAALAAGGCVLAAKLSWVAHFALLALPIATLLASEKPRRLAWLAIVAFAGCAWSSFRATPSWLRLRVEDWSLFAVAGLMVTLALATLLRQCGQRAASPVAQDTP